MAFFVIRISLSFTIMMRFQSKSHDFYNLYSIGKELASQDKYAFTIEVSFSPNKKVNNKQNSKHLRPHCLSIGVKVSRKMKYCSCIERSISSYVTVNVCSCSCPVTH